MSDREDLKIRVNMVAAQKVIFLKPIFEDDFPEKGMSAWLVDVEWDKKHLCYKLYFDFAEFEAENEKYFKAVYYSNRRTAELEASTGRKMFTAKEAGFYDPKYSVHFYVESVEHRDDEAFEREITNYLCTRI